MIEEPSYGLYWHGKREAARAAGAPFIGRLRRVDGDGCGTASENRFIEADNLDALKGLRPEFAGRIKLIYIDPPYNTGGALVYDDNFRQTAKAYRDATGRDAPETPTARRHTAWLDLMYPRLLAARELLADDGLIAVSIDDNELAQLKLLCDEVFGPDGFVAQVSVVANPRGRQSAANLAVVHEYLLLYARDPGLCRLGVFPLTDEQKAGFPLREPDGRAYRLLGLRQRGVDSLREQAPTMFFPLYVNPATMTVSLDRDGGHDVEVIPRKSDGRESRWMWSREKCRVDRALLVPRLIRRRNEYDVFVKDYLVRDGVERGRKPTTQWDGRHLNTQNGTQEVKALLGADTASFPKPVAYIRDIVKLATGGDDWVMDFFAGSGTTGHAVMAQNCADGGRRRFVLVELPEPLDPARKEHRSAARFCAGIGKPATRAEIAKERLRRAAAALRAAHPRASCDLGFSVYVHDPERS